MGSRVPTRRLGRPSGAPAAAEPSVPGFQHPSGERAARPQPPAPGAVVASSSDGIEGRPRVHPPRRPQSRFFSVLARPASCLKQRRPPSASAFPHVSKTLFEGRAACSPERCWKPGTLGSAAAGAPQLLPGRASPGVRTLWRMRTKPATPRRKGQVRRDLRILRLKRGPTGRCALGQPLSLPHAASADLLFRMGLRKSMVGDAGEGVRVRGDRVVYVRGNVDES